MSKNESITFGNQLIREAIEAGEKSGYVKNFDPIKHLAELNSKKQQFEKTSLNT